MTHVSAESGPPGYVEITVYAVMRVLDDPHLMTEQGVKTRRALRTLFIDHIHSKQPTINALEDHTWTTVAQALQVEYAGANAIPTSLVRPSVGRAVAESSGSASVGGDGWTQPLPPPH